MSGPGTPAKGGQKANATSSQPPAKPKTPHIDGHIEGQIKVNTQEQSPASTANRDGRYTTKTITDTKSVAGFPVVTNTHTETTYTRGGDEHFTSGARQKQTEMSVGGRVNFNNNPVEEDKKTAKPVRSQPSKKIASKAAHPVTPLPAEDAIIITTGKDTLQMRNADLGMDATMDATMLAASAHRLRKALEKGGVLGDSVKADLNIKGLEDVETLSILLQKDYTSIQEGTIKLQYLDHRDPSFHAAVGEISITHDSIVQLTNAFNKAEQAVKDLTSGVSGGATVSQADITNTVRNTLKKELAATL